MKRIVRITAIISRVLAGCVFIFSGFVKAVDPLGSTYKFTDYFCAFSMPWLESVSFPLAILLSALEFTIGFCLLIFIQNRLANWGALLFMIVFTPLTLWLALTDPVQDCGCFGDALILTNWQTFYKNIIISLLIILSFQYRNSMIRWVKRRTEWVITIVVFIIVVGFSWCNYQHLPMVDFRPYKAGTYIPDKMIIPEGAPANVYKQFFTLRDTLSGKEISIESNVYMDDSTYWGRNSSWKFMSTSEAVLVKKGYEPPIHDFSIVSFSGEDITRLVLADTGYYFILVAYDLNKSRKRHLTEINTLYHKVIAAGHKLICLTSSNEREVEQFKKSFNPEYDFYITDPITLKTIIRANPGLVLLHEGTILAKWHSNDIPEFNLIKENFLH